VRSSSKDVDAYIARASRDSRGKLRQMRKIIIEIAPDSVESISYGMPGDDKGAVAWFALAKNNIGLYLRPPIIEEHKRELASYETTKSAVHFPLDKKLPVRLIKKLLMARIARNRELNG